VNHSSGPDATHAIVALLTRIAEAVERAADHRLAIDRSLSLVDPEYLSINQAAAVAGLSATTIRREIKAGRLPASDIGTPAHPHYRIAKADLQLWMEKNRGGNNIPPQPQRMKRKVQSRYFSQM